MKDFLTEFYNKVVNFFQAEKVDGENTKETAKNRLKLVLMQDRSNLEPETMSKLREELIEVISKYIVIDKEALGLNLDGDGESMALMLNIPVIRAKTSEEIEEALAAAKKAVEEVEDASETENEEAEQSDEDETVVEFSEGSIEEILPCDGECNCGCQEGEPCECGKENIEGNCGDKCECLDECASESIDDAADENIDESSDIAEETENTPELPETKKKNKKK